MKKIFPLRVSGKANARVVESIKHDVRKYVKRERRKSLPQGFDQWDFACKVGATGTAAESQLLAEVGAAIDRIVASGGSEVYVEVIAIAAHRTPRVVAPLGTELSPPATPTPTAGAPSDSDESTLQSS